MIYYFYLFNFKEDINIEDTSIPLIKCNNIELFIRKSVAILNYSLEKV
jgi:hypothetical protein